MTLHTAAGMVPLVVRAKMAAGVAHAVPWGISLDGLLASEIRENTKAAARAAGTDYEPYSLDTVPEDLDLPLARCPGDGADRWHWAATFAYPEDEVPGPHVQYWSARPDQQALSQMADQLPALVSERQGRYRSRVMPLPLTVCRHLVWRAVGHPAAVAALLEPIISIGKKRGTGNGHILSWEIAEHPDADPWEFAHLHPDGKLGRTGTRGLPARARQPADRWGGADGAAAAVHAPIPSHPGASTSDLTCIRGDARNPVGSGLDILGYDPPRADRVGVVPAETNSRARRSRTRCQSRPG